MGGGASSSPPQFNAAGASQQQTQSNVQTAAANAYAGAQNQYTPYGNLIYTEGTGHDVGGTHLPEFSVTQTMSPSQQAIYDKQTGLQNQALGLGQQVIGQVGQSVNTPLNYSGMQNISAPISGNQSDYQKQAYDALTSRSTQDLDRQQEATKIQLANQGLNPGTDAYNNGLLPIMREYTDASNQATINANQLAGQNISQQGQVMSQQQGLRNQQISEMMQKRNQPLQDYQALMGFSGGNTQPNYAPSIPYQVANTDMIGPQIAQYQGQVNAYNQQLGAGNAAMGGMFGLGGSVLGGLARAPGVQSFMGLA